VVEAGGVLDVTELGIGVGGPDLGRTSEQQRPQGQAQAMQNHAFSR